MLRKRIVTLVSLALMLGLALLLAACKTTVTTYPCRAPSGGTTQCVGVVITKAATAETLDASTFYETREVDPTVYGPDTTSPATGTLTLTLTSGGTVTYPQNLYYDSATTIAPYTPGYKVLVYRPANPAALQGFINQYKAQTAEFAIDTTIPLLDISSGSVDSSTVDAQGRYNSTIVFHGTVNTEPPSRDRGPIEM